MDELILWPPTWSMLLMLPALFVGFTVHELGHALGLLHEHLVLSLFAFMLGVAIGQVAIAAVLVPVLYTVRRLTLYSKVVLPAAAVAMILISGVWIVERTFDVDVPMRESLPEANRRMGCNVGHFDVRIGQDLAPDDQLLLIATG